MMGDDRTGRDRTGDGTPKVRARLTVSEAAEALGISAEAVRQRLKRNTLAHTKTDEGRVFVFVETDRMRQDSDTTTDRTADRTEDRAELVDELRDRVAFLERELDRRSVEAARYQEIVARLANANAQLSARVPELEAAPPREEEAPPGAPENAGSDVGGARAPTAQPSPQTGARRPWWRRILGG